MPLQVTQKYVIRGQNSAEFNKDWVTYEAYRNALIKISERDALLLEARWVIPSNARRC